jgi:CheY-like chemotaxis protein
LILNKLKKENTVAKIMLVEDDNNLREIYQARLNSEGFETVTASDGEEALSIVGREKPDLIVLDVMMPKLSGFDTLDLLKNNPVTKDIKVIMMTALSQAEDRAKAQKLGAQNYLVKSQVTLEDIVKAIKDTLAGSSTYQTEDMSSSSPQPEDPYASVFSSNPQDSPTPVDTTTSDDTTAPVSDTTTLPTEPTPAPVSDTPTETPVEPTPEAEPTLMPELSTPEPDTTPVSDGPIIIEPTISPIPAPVSDTPTETPVDSAVIEAPVANDISTPMMVDHTNDSISDATTLPTEPTPAPVSDTPTETPVEPTPEAEPTPMPELDTSSLIDSSNPVSSTTQNPNPVLDSSTDNNQ